jgi:polysaccharide pyruvyl transferase WcaK-like protein
MFSLKMEYGEMIRTLIARLKAHPEAPKIFLVPHVFASQDTESIGVEDDREAALTLQNEDPDLTVAPQFESPQAAKSYIAGLDFFAGARMHACIAAFSSGVPVIPMAYSRKFAGLFGSLGYDRTVDCTQEDSASIVEKVITGFEARQTLLKEQRPALALGLEKLAGYERALEDLIADLVRR